MARCLRERSCCSHWSSERGLRAAARRRPQHTACAGVAPAIVEALSKCIAVVKDAERAKHLAWKQFFEMVYKHHRGAITSVNMTGLKKAILFFKLGAKEFRLNVRA